MVHASTILAVDDDPASLLILSNVLKMDSGYTVLTATNVADGMVVAERHQPDLVITDRNMPGKDGFEFCRWIKAHATLANTMVVVLTASGETASIVKGLDIGADDYLVKPFHPEELHSRIRALLRIKRLSDQLKTDNARLEALNAALNENLAGVMHLITHIIELRVPDASLRADRARVMAQWIGGRMGVEGEELDAIVLAARVHEIGKIVMPDEVLVTVAEQLTGDQRDTLAQFPVFGQMLVGRIPQLRDVAVLVRAQMENWDGTGLPDHHRGKQIPVGARILRAVNIVAETPAGTPTDQIVERLHRARGTALDPVVVQCAIEYITTLSDPSWMKGKRQVPVANMQEGMITATDICTANGVMLLPKETRLTKLHVTRIQAHHMVDPILSAIYIYDAA